LPNQIFGEGGDGILTATILSRVARGEPNAVQECIDRYGALVWSLARRQLGSSLDAEDAVQEIFIELWKSAERFDPSRSSEAGFIAMVARRRIIDRLRQRGRMPDLEALDDRHEVVPDPRAGLDPETHAEAALAARALGQLRPQQKQVLELLIQEGLTHEQVAQSTGMPLGTVKTHARRGLIRLREILTTKGKLTAGRSTS
jgi:RNA polymerase sigma factor (sigma-70 family)